MNDPLVPFNVAWNPPPPRSGYWRLAFCTSVVETQTRGFIVAVLSLPPTRYGPHLGCCCMLSHVGVNYVFPSPTNTLYYSSTVPCTALESLTEGGGVGGAKCQNWFRMQGRSDGGTAEEGKCM